MPPPSWLPDIVTVDGVWEHVVEMLYDIFVRDFVDGTPQCLRLRVTWDTRILSADRRCEGFWHLITKTERGDRLFDPRRAERLPWAGPLIAHSGDPIVKCWEYLEATRRVRIYLWLEELDYVVILEHHKQVARLVTAFYVDGNSKRRDLENKYRKQIKANAAH